MQHRKTVLKKQTKQTKTNKTKKELNHKEDWPDQGVAGSGLRVAMERNMAVKAGLSAAELVCRVPVLASPQFLRGGNRGQDGVCRHSISGSSLEVDGIAQHH